MFKFQIVLALGKKYKNGKRHGIERGNIHLRMFGYIRVFVVVALFKKKIVRIFTSAGDAICD